jgi:hypothetical protein
VLGIRRRRSPRAYEGRAHLDGPVRHRVVRLPAFITFIIVTFIAGKFFVIGVLLAIWAMATQW